MDLVDRELSVMMVAMELLVEVVDTVETLGLFLCLLLCLLVWFDEPPWTHGGNGFANEFIWIFNEWGGNGFGDNLIKVAMDVATSAFEIINDHVSNDLVGAIMIRW